MEQRETLTWGVGLEEGVESLGTGTGHSNPLGVLTEGFYLGQILISRRLLARGNPLKQFLG